MIFKDFLSVILTLMEEISEDQDLMFIYDWVDSVNLSRPKKHVGRDFSDGVMMAELIKHHIPKIVELHNYPSTTNSSQKLYNWTTLNQKVFKKLGVRISLNEIENIINCKPLCIENFLKVIHKKIKEYILKNKSMIENNENSKLYNNTSIRQNHDTNTSSNINQKVKNLNVENSLIEEMIRELQEKKSQIAKMTKELSNLEVQSKTSEENQSKLNKRIMELNEKCMKLK